MIMVRVRVVLRSIFKSAFVVGCSFLTACVNQAGQTDPYRALVATQAELAVAGKEKLPYVITKRGNLQTFEEITYQTTIFGPITILPGFVADGSSRPFDKNRGSQMASLLHDAFYRGAAQMRFERGFPGRWSKNQADLVYCEQLRLQNAPKRLARSNCLGIRLVPGAISPWDFHRKRRTEYWEAQERLVGIR